jgi:hypothetical protein
VRAPKVRGWTEKVRVSALKVHALTDEGGLWTEEPALRTVEVRGSVPEVRVWTDEGRPFPLKVSVRTLFGALTIPSRDGCVPFGDAIVPEEGPDDPREVRYRPPRGRSRAPWGRNHPRRVRYRPFRGRNRTSRG